MVIACAAILTFFAVMMLDEPEGSMAEILPDGTVQMIEMT
jgi:NNP family nitrate/nitrite transporter-like MFS transporter